MTRRTLLQVAPALLAAAPAKHIVLVSGDEEYRSEELLPQLAKILSRRHGFRTTVLFAIDKTDGTVNPEQNDNIPGLGALDSADLLVLHTRYRDLPDHQMRHIVDYVESGRPIFGLRTATHAFELKSSPTYADYSSTRPDGGFGRRVLGETWIRHHGEHGKQSSLGVINPAQAKHPVLRGIRTGDLWSPTDVYETRLPLPGDSQTLVFGQVLAGMASSDPHVSGPVNNHMMPVFWTRHYRQARVVTTTFGTSAELLRPGMRRLYVNACYWALGLDHRIHAKSNVDLVGDYKPLPFLAGGYAKGLKPEALTR